MLSRLSKIFAVYKEAVLIVKCDEIVYYNVAAERAFPDIQEKRPRNLLPDIVLDYEADSFSGTILVGGAARSASVVDVDGYRIIIVSSFGDGENRITLLNNVGTHLKENINVLKMATGVLTPYIETSGNEKMTRYNRIINKTSQVLQRMVGNMTYLVASDNSVFDPVCLELNQLIKEITESAAAFLGDGFAKITFTPYEDPLTVYADRDKLELAIYQLISNSIKSTTPESEVRIAVKRINNSAAVCVSDNGSGIPEDQLSDIWEAGRVMNYTAGSGVGAGLPILQSIARLHGGGAIIESIAGKGTKVTFTIQLSRHTGNVLNTSAGRYDSGMSTMLTQLSDVLPFDRFSGKYMD